VFLSRCQCPNNPEEFIGRPCAWKGSRAKQFSHHHYNIWNSLLYYNLQKRKTTTSLLHFPTLSHNQQHCHTLSFFSLIQHHVCFMFLSLYWILVTHQRYLHKKYLFCESLHSHLEFQVSFNLWFVTIISFYWMYNKLAIYYCNIYLFFLFCMWFQNFDSSSYILGGNWLWICACLHESDIYSYNEKW